MIEVPEEGLRIWKSLATSMSIVTYLTRKQRIWIPCYEGILTIWKGE